MWNVTCFRLETVLVSVQNRYMVCARRTIVSEIFWTHLMVPLVTRLKWKLISVHLEILRILMQDRCTICAERTIGSGIICTHTMELLGDVGHAESHFFLFGDSVSVGAR